jgi:thiol-disulfide isomerase/thioredoxin
MRSINFNIVAIIITFSLMLTACQSPASISGKISGTTDKEMNIYLIKPESLWDVGASYTGRIIDSAVVNPDGSFEFNNLQNIEEPALLEIAIQVSGKPPKYLETDDVAGSNYMPVFWNPKETLEITAKADEFQKTFSIKNPSKNNKVLLALRDINQKAYQTYLAGKQWNVEEAEELMDKEHSILQYQRELMAFADSTSNFIPAMLALRWISPELDYERVPEIMVRQCNKWIEELVDHPWLNQLCSQSNPDDLPVLVGDVFPNVKLPMITKDTVFINDLLGEKLTIIDLWASWCAPCRLENRNTLVPIWDEYHDQGLQIIAYGLESDEEVWRSAAEKDGANSWYQSSDLQGDDALFLQQIRIQTIPSNFILDDKGVILAKNVHGNELMDFVKEYLENK